MATDELRHARISSSKGAVGYRVAVTGGDAFGAVAQRVLCATHQSCLGTCRATRLPALKPTLKASQQSSASSNKK